MYKSLHVDHNLILLKNRINLNPHIHDHIKSIVHIKSLEVLDVQVVDSETHKVAIGNCVN